ncbi:hypothetical protein CerSpe_213900 [Prunus speciosa]
MKGGTVQINWHDTKPVLTLDFHPTSGTLATGGDDFNIKVLTSTLSLFLCIFTNLMGGPINIEDNDNSCWNSLG